MRATQGATRPQHHSELRRKVAGSQGHLYGKPKDASPDNNDGAYGYKDVDEVPFLGMNSCGNDPIFKNGKGCGSCFEVKCSKLEACSEKPVVVHITNMKSEPIAA
ncbi:hypothetical protein E2562_012146 [Oryza meyeriana var. granulata]|uniref:Expansin-like EG45 domain-containing protein n=1 Tax=Oryza meyeriana var. granulata TaxID=110450 RepID=A0A6G1F7H3_9ORYZ|nr:hypothetical protein E2562_012146 [Oryza meyeriana var. granulata]